MLIVILWQQQNRFYDVIIINGQQKQWRSLCVCVCVPLSRYHTLCNSRTHTQKCLQTGVIVLCGVHSPKCMKSPCWEHCHGSELIPLFRPVSHSCRASSVSRPFHRVLTALCVLCAFKKIMFCPINSYNEKLNLKNLRVLVHHP